MNSLLISIDLFTAANCEVLWSLPKTIHVYHAFTAVICKSKTLEKIHFTLIGNAVELSRPRGGKSRSWGLDMWESPHMNHHLGDVSIDSQGILCVS